MFRCILTLSYFRHSATLITEVTPRPATARVEYIRGMATRASGAPGATGLALELAVAKHGSAAGSVARTSDVATEGGLTSTPRIVSPLGLGHINDDAEPSGKRRVVSR